NSFGVMSNALITGIITEKGIIRGDYKREIASLFEKQANT
ncbi:S-methyl-5-thioribose-1-phosphate isomerase, partial [Bacillus sp. B-TM1]